MHGCIKIKTMPGMTLIDVIIAVAIMSLVAVIAIPSFNSNQKYRLELAVNEVVHAIRFARSESMRTGDIYGVDIDRSNTQITIYKANITTNPVGQEFIAYHPINKDLYDYNLANDFNLPDIAVDNPVAIFLFADTQRRDSLLFDKNGTPVWFNVGSNATTQLSEAAISLSLAGLKQSIVIQPYNGRILIQ